MRLGWWRGRSNFFLEFTENMVYITTMEGILLMSNSNFLIFNRVFSRNTLNAFINSYTPTPYVVAIKRSSIDPNNKENKKIISEIYHYMVNNYRNEYIYKNTLLNNLLFFEEKYSIDDTTALTEIIVGRSKADFVLINGNAEVYEIKTELDNFDRLESQIHDYYKAFARVNIVTSPDKYDVLKNILSDSKIGMYILDKELNIIEMRKVKNEKKYLDTKTIFKILRKKEYENILLNNYGELPFVSQFDYYKECLKKFEEISLKKMYPLFLAELRKRCCIQKSYFAALPNSINSLVYFSNIKKTDFEKLSFFLESTYSGGQYVLSLS